MSTEPRTTRQGVRDLNNYGPKPRKPGAAPQPGADEGDTGAQPPTDAKTADDAPAEQSPANAPS